MAVSRTRLESILLDLEADLQPAASVYRPLQADGHAAAEAADLAPWDPIVVDDLIGGTDGDDTLAGTVGDDTLDGGLGADSMAGGAGNDTYVVDNAADIVTELDGEGTDSVLASVSHTLALDVENLTLTGIEAINATGNTAANVLIGNSGANVINGGKGADTMVGGAGNDTYYLDSAADVITELAGEGSDTVKASISYSLGSGLEKLVLTGGAALTGAGNNNNNSLTGNTGNNRLTGNGGNDVLDGGAGVDTLDGGTGNDTYVLDSTTDTVIEMAGGGVDLVKASVSVVLAAEVENLTLVEGAAINGTGNTMANTLLGNTLNNVLDGGAGIDTLNGGKGNDSYVVDDAADMVNELADEGTDTVQTSLSWTLGANLENLTLLGSDTLNATGNTLKNLLTGNSAANVLDGGSGADTMAGGAGNDTYLVDNANDVVTEVSGQGVDTAQASVSYALGAGVEKLVLTGNAALNGTGNNLANTLTGNSAANQLDGGVGADTLVGGQGNDVYLVDDAADVVTEVAGQGTDEVRASITAVLAAEVERLTLTGTADLGGTGNSMDNLITGNSGLNTLNGLTGNDTLDGGAGADTLVGGAGDDTYLVDIAADVITEVSGEGNDTVRSSVTYTLGAQVENLVLEGSANVNAVGNGLANTLTGNTGNNTLNGGSGADTMQGGTGNDLYIFENAADQAVELADEGIDTVQASLTTTLGNNLENLTLSGTAALNGKGNSLANSLLGNSAANQLEGLGGNDTLDGGAGGVDTLIGGNGNDTYEIADNTDILTELSGGGIDTVLASFTNYTLGAQLENLTLTGSANLNGYGNELSNEITGNAGLNVLVGGNGNDTLLGLAGEDNLQGEGGDDSIDGGTGNDVITDYYGTNTYVFKTGNGADTVNNYNGYDGLYNDVVKFSNVASTANIKLLGEGGNLILKYGNSDQITFTAALGSTGSYYRVSNFSFSDGVTLTLEQLLAQNTLTLSAASDTVYLSNYAETVLGGLGNDVVVSYGGNDKVSGEDGNDTLYAGDGNDSMLGGIDNDLIYGENGNDTLSGDDGNDNLLGGNDADSLIGGAGDDQVQGESGNDTLDGGTGADTYTDYYGTNTYVFKSGAGADTLNNYNGYDGLYGDVVKFSNVASTANISLLGDGSSLILKYGASDQITFAQALGGNGSYYQVSNYTFSDGVTLSLQQLLAAETLTFGGNSDTAYLTNFAETVLAGLGNDLIVSYGGNDKVTGEGGNDTLYGGDGTDSLLGGIDNDVLYGEAGNDTLTGDDGNDYLIGGNDADSLIGGAGDDNLQGDAGNDSIDGGSGADTITDYYGTNTYTFKSGAGADTLNNYNGYDGLANDVVKFSNIASTANISLLGDGTSLILKYGASDQITFAQALGSSGSYYQVSNYTFSDGVTLSLQQLLAAETLTFGGNSDTAYLTNFAETVLGGLGNDLIVSYGGNDKVTGEGGNDTLYGGDGTDSLLGGIDNDVLYGEAGNDTLTGDDGNDYLIGGNDADSLIGGAGDDNLQGDAGNDSIDGGSGADTITDYYGTNTYVFKSGAGADTLNNYNGYDGLYGDVVKFSNVASTANISLLGDGSSLILKYGASDQITFAQALGSSGSYYQVSNYTFSDGVTLSLQQLLAAETLTFGGNSDTAYLTNFAETVLGGLGSDLIVSYGGTDKVSGEEGNDTLYAGDGNDSLLGGIDNDVLYGEGGNDTLSGDDGNDYVIGGNDNDSLLGGAGDDNLQGESGTDTLEGGTGNDTLTDFYGNNTYVFKTGAGADTLNTYNGYDGLSADVIKFTNLASTGNFSLEGSGANLIFKYGASDQITIQNAIGSSGSYYQVNNFAFSDGVTLSLQQLLAAETLTLSSNSDSVYLSNYGETVLAGLGNDLVVSYGGNDQVSGQDGTDTLYGGDGNDTLIGGAGTDYLFGEVGSDTIVLDSLTGPDVVYGFASGSDRIQISQATLALGDGDLVKDTVKTVTGPGGFGTGAELIVVTDNIVGALSTTSAAAQIGNASSPYAIGATALFVVDNGTDSGLYYFEAADANGTVSAAELTLLATISGNAALTTADFVFGA